MKNFKFKLSIFSNLLKKIKFFKKININLENKKKPIKFKNKKKKFLEIYNRFYVKKFGVNYFIFFISLVSFCYLIYLSFPGILHNKSDQNYLTKILSEKYDLEFSLTPEINYSILPKPHFQINDVVIFNNVNSFQKEIAQIKKLKICNNN